MTAAATPQKRKSTLEQRNKDLRLELENTVLERRLSSIKQYGKYDAVEPNRKRRTPSVETKSEDQILDPRKRALSHNIGRDLERNFAPARGIINQFRVNVVGAEGKIQINTPDGAAAANWFNRVWAKECDYRDDLHWSTILQNVVAGCIREGDVLAVFDDELTPDDSGKLIHYEADQICSLSEGEFKKVNGYADGWSQEGGIVRDRLGKVLGYIVTGKRGQIVIDKIEDATFFPRSAAKLVKNPWRLNQGRGISAMLTAATNFQDLYEILSKELQSAKVAASIAGWTKRSDAVTDWDDPASGSQYLPENSGKDAVTTALEGANSTDPAQPNYERFESLTGGMWEYLAKGDETEFAKIDRPNVHLAEFMEAVLGHAGASVGLARAYTILRADSSYTSFRGDMVLSWATFYMLQKWLERDYADWVAHKAISHAIRKGVVSLATGWESAISWKWPKTPSVDELKESTATRQKLKNGTADYSQLIGPDWRNHFDALSEQIQYGRDKNIPLSVFETTSGGVAPSEEQKNEQD
jgi:capsid protein